MASPCVILSNIHTIPAVRSGGEERAMSKFLLVSYYFPPIGGAGAQRPLKFARYLLDHGHTAIVLTGSGRTGELWTPADPTLSADIPPGVEVVRVPGPEPDQLTTIGSRLQRLVRVPDLWERWWQAGVASTGARFRGVDAIYTILSPYSSAEPSRALAQQLGIGWIADLGDPWALDEMVLYPTEIHRRLEISRMRKLLGSAAAIVMSTPEAVRQLVEMFPELADRPVVAIPNGFDAADFADAAVAPREPGTFRIVHTGYLHTELGLQQRSRAPIRQLLGGGYPGVDILTRSHVYLLQAVDRLLARDPSLGRRLEVHFAGVLSEADRELAVRSPVVQLRGYLPHTESVALIRSADLLFLPMQNVAPGSRSTTVPGKTYEYLASGRPILGAVPPGDARDILERVGHIVCDPDDIEGMMNAITTTMAGRGARAGNEDLTRRFAYENLANDVAAVIESVSRRPRRRLTHETPRPSRRPDGALNILMLAYYFPPIGGAGAQRTLKFVRYLPDNGCRPTVVTGPGFADSPWAPSDGTLSDEIPEDARIVCVPGPEPVPSLWGARAERWLRLQSDWSRWWTNGLLDAARSALRDTDVILASASPYETINAGARIARLLGKPWIADLRDPWALDEMVLYPTEIHRRLEISRMRKLLGSAAAIVMSTPEAVRQLVEMFPELADRPVVAIPNGFDAADFADAAVAPREPGTFRIVHTGYLHTELGLQQRSRAPIRQLLGGGYPGVDILTRSHVYLLQAVDRLLARDPSLGRRLEVHFAGVLSEADRELAVRSPVVQLRGYLPHTESVALIRSADLLFLPMQNVAPGSRSTTVPGKTYEYLASGRPILGAVPPGDARDILERVGHIVCDPDDVTAIAGAIAASLAQHDEKTPPPDLDWEVVQGFDRRDLTRRLADLTRIVVNSAAVEIATSNA